MNTETMSPADVLAVMADAAKFLRAAKVGTELDLARAAVAALIAAGDRARRCARLMHDEHQQETICIPPAQWRELCAALAACKPATGNDA